MSESAKEVLEILLLASVLGASYSYCIYPIILSFFPRTPEALSKDANSAFDRRVTLIIACRNESRRIASRLDNALALTYKDLEILVASDASDDGSDQIVQSYSERGVRLVRSPSRLGKEAAQRLAVSQSSGSFIVFSDAGTEMLPDSIQLIVDVLSRAGVGAVSSEDTLISSDGSVVGEGAYVRYEMWLRRLESSTGGVVGLSGSLFAVRRTVALRLVDSVPSDFCCAIVARELGLAAVSDPRLRGIYCDISDPSREFSRKVRTALRGMAAVAYFPSALNPFRNGLFAFKIWSHKIMRWLVPWFLISSLLLSVVLSPASVVIAFFLALQVTGYAVLLLVHALPARFQGSIFKSGYYFLVANAALMQASVMFVLGKRVVTWSPSIR